MGKRAALGRDFFSLLDDNSVVNEKKESANAIRISDIEPRSNQPRKTFEVESLQALADSISHFGVLQPILVRNNPAVPGMYEIIAGERRWRASKMAGLSEIPAIVLTGDELETAQISIIENVQREDLNPLEEALAYDALIDQFNLTQEQVSEKVGKSRVAVTNALRLLDLPDEVLDFVRSGALSAGAARALLGLADKTKIADLAQKVIDKDMSVRTIEATVRLLNATKNDQDEDEEEPLTQKSANNKDIERRALSILGRRVKIVKSDRKKVLELTYTDDEDLENLLKTLCGEDFFENN